MRLGNEESPTGRRRARCNSCADTLPPCLSNVDERKATANSLTTAATFAATVANHESRLIVPAPRDGTVHRLGNRFSTCPEGRP